MIVYTDETYVHQHAGIEQTWDQPGRRSKKQQMDPSKGKLIIIVHALTVDGLLYCGENRKLTTGTALDQEIHSTEWIFPAKNAFADYHDSMDGDMFFAWLNYRLLPTFKTKYPGKKIYLVLDNAGYHKRKCREYIDVGDLNRPELVRLLQPGPEAMQKAQAESEAALHTVEEAHKTVVKARIKGTEAASAAARAPPRSISCCQSRPSVCLLLQSNLGHRRWS